MTKWLKTIHSNGWRILFHSLAVLFVAVVIAVPTMDWVQAQMFWESFSVHGFEPNWLGIALHIGLAGCLWALGVIAFMWVRARQTESKDVKRLVKKAKGTVVTEFLIIFTPFLLLTSGLAQLAMLNVTGLLADLAAFQGARVVWVWAQEIDQPRYEARTDYGNIHIHDRARTIASMALAPTAANDYYLGRSVAPGSSNYYRRQRAWVVGGFMPDSTSPSESYEWSGGEQALTGGGAFDIDLREDGAVGQNLTYLSAFDKYGFKWRAARKMTQAEWGLYWDFETICPSSKCNNVNANESGVHFEYWYNLIFPWFGYIWGEQETVGMREGWYAKIERRHTFPAQPMP